MHNPTDREQPHRIRVNVDGIVQGVGFRPFVYRTAHRYGLAGTVRNSPTGVLIEVEGSATALDSFVETVRADAPPLAVITGINVSATDPLGATGFSIDTSSAKGERTALIAPDVTVCSDCLRELFDPADRRYLYPFINCTNCGPRYTIIRDIPYDRPKTTMAGFVMCPECQKEYDDPLDRRFHAQPNACRTCGPKMTLIDNSGRVIDTDDPISVAARHLADGRIVAVKSLGGFQIAVDATRHESVVELRNRKRREEKPLAVMVPDIETAETLCFVSSDERSELISPQRPIVVLDLRENSPIDRSVAPFRHDLGVMLPYTPMHYLLFWAKPFTALVMTSGNLSEEPICTENEEAIERFGDIADFFLVHNRPIHLRSDDSVLRVNAHGSGMLRRSRGYAPRPVFVEFDMPSILACGAELKNTVCLTKGRRAFISQHVGDLQNIETYRFHVDTVTHMRRILDIEPELLVHDLHPDYLCTPTGGGIPIPEQERDPDLRTFGVQHHHAHIASVMAENGIDGPVIGIALDGTGYGTDGNIWGGEFMLVEYTGFRRLGHIEYVPIPGGDAAARQAWRSAAGYLAKTFGIDKGRTLARELMPEIPVTSIDGVFAMIERSINSPSSSGCGRLFDAVSALAGIRVRSSYEGQAPSEFESIMTETDAAPYDFAIVDSSTEPEVEFNISFAPMIEAIVDDMRNGTEPGVISRRVHETVVEACVAAARRVRAVTDVESIALSGGVFQNRFLARSVPERLTAERFTVYTHISVPPNDGGISLGQAAVAAHIVAERKS